MTANDQRSRGSHVERPPALNECAPWKFREQEQIGQNSAEARANQNSPEQYSTREIKEIEMPKRCGQIKYRQGTSLQSCTS